MAKKGRPQLPQDPSRSIPTTNTSVDKAISIVELLASVGQAGLPLVELSERLGLHKSTVHHALGILRRREWVDQNPENGNYTIGDGVWPLARYSTSVEQLTELVRPALNAISADYNELVHLGRLRGPNIVYLDKVEPDRAIRVVSYVGREAPAASTSLGRAILGFTTPDANEVAGYLHAIKNPTPEFIESFERNLENVRLHGWASEQGENEPGISCVGVPFRVGNSRPLAVSVSAPSERMNKKRFKEIAHGIGERLRETAAVTGIELPESLD